VVPRSQMKEVAAMLKAIHGQKDTVEAQKKADTVADKLEQMKLRKAAQTVREGTAETLSYYAFVPQKRPGPVFYR